MSNDVVRFSVPYSGSNVISAESEDLHYHWSIPCPEGGTEATGVG